MIERPGLLPTIPWPPIITDVRLPRYIIWRDRLLTIAAWLLLLTLASDLFVIVIARALELSGRSQTGPGAQWPIWWERLRPFAMVIALMAVWLVLWGLMSLRRVRIYRRMRLPASLTLAEEAAHAGCTEADLTAWRGLRIAVAHLDEAGRPSVVPGRADG
jgi:poly-beta-1,6-N-acetyl-D-glucosamine biosynthesis protein PgaD